MFNRLFAQRLDDRDFYLIEIVRNHNESEKLFTYEDMAAMTGQCVRTVSGRMRRLQKKGIVKSKRIAGTRSYTHVLASLDKTPTGRETRKGRGGMGLGEEGKSYRQPPIIINNKKELGEELRKNLDLDKRLIGTNSKTSMVGYIVKRSVGSDKSIGSVSNLGGARASSNVGEEVELTAASSSEDLLQGVIDSALAKSSTDLDTTKEKRQVKRETNAASAGRQRYETRQSKAMRKHTEKSVDDYTCKDLEIVFREQWEASDFNGSAFGWTRKEVGQMRNFLGEQPAADIVTYIEYVFSNWPRILQRYAVRGVPTVGLLYGFRRSWFAECFNGELGTVGRGESSMLEYDPKSTERDNTFAMLDGKYRGRNTLEYDPESTEHDNTFAMLDGKYRGKNTLEYDPTAKKDEGFLGSSPAATTLEQLRELRETRRKVFGNAPDPGRAPTVRKRTVKSKVPVRPVPKRAVPDREALPSPEITAVVASEPGVAPDAALDKLLGSLDEIASLSTLSYGFGDAPSIENIDGADDVLSGDGSEKCRTRK